MGWFRRSAGLPPALTQALAPGEHVTAPTPTTDGQLLAASRFGLWIVGDGTAQRWDWHRISRARLAEKVLGLTVADEVGQWDRGVTLLKDRAEIRIEPVRLTKLTDAIHDRVRRSVAASAHVEWPGSGGWVVLRRIAGRDGLAVQVRLDAHADPGAAGFAAAVDDMVDRLWPPTVPR